MKAIEVTEGLAARIAKARVYQMLIPDPYLLVAVQDLQKLDVKLSHAEQVSRETNTCRKALCLKYQHNKQGGNKDISQRPVQLAHCRKGMRQ